MRIDGAASVAALRDRFLVADADEGHDAGMTQIRVGVVVRLSIVETGGSISLTPSSPAASAA